MNEYQINSSESLAGEEKKRKSGPIEWTTAATIIYVFLSIMGNARKLETGVINDRR